MQTSALGSVNSLLIKNVFILFITTYLNPSEEREKLTRSEVCHGLLTMSHI